MYGKRRFVADSAYVLDTLTGQRHFGRRVFDIDGGEFDEVNLSPSDRAQIFSDIGVEVCVDILQRAFEAQDKPYNARSVIDNLINANFTKKNRFISEEEKIKYRGKKSFTMTPEEVVYAVYGHPPCPSCKGKLKPNPDNACSSCGYKRK